MSPRPGRARGTALLAAAALAALAGSPPAAPQEPAPPRQTLHSRNPVRTDTTFGFRFRRSQAVLEGPGGRAVLTATLLPVDEREYAEIASIAPGELVRLERAAAMKLTIDEALDFGTTVVPTGNVAAGFHGAYGVWLRRRAEGWDLLFNDEADAWGTQHDPAFDRATVALVHGEHSGSTGPLTVALEGTVDDARLRITWGEHEWSAPFRVAAGSGQAPAGGIGHDWPSQGGDSGASRYSPLDRIDAGNVASLAVAWRWTSADEPIQRAHPELRSRRHEAIPIVVDGRLFTVTSLSQLAAIDAGSGTTLWVFDPGSWRAGPPTNLGFVHRGCAYWRNPTTGEERLIYATGDAWLVAVDATAGRAVPDFGDGGRVDLIPGIPLARRPAPGKGRGNYTVSSPPIVVRDVIVVGSSIADRPNTLAMPRGDVRGFDVRSGELLWTFHTVPQPGEYGNDTWLDESWRTTGNTNVWTMMSADEHLGLVYLPVTTPTSDYYGAHRRGAGLFAESLVALEAETGRRVWHFQGVHHGLWDYDFPAAPNLVDIEIDGRPIRAVAQISKQGFTYVFDRANGDPVWPIEERPVPASQVPGEETWPTQPFPTRPPAFESQGSTVDNLIDFTPELRAEAVEILLGYGNGPLFTPPSERGTLQLPGSAGGANWGGAAFDPETDVLFVPSITMPIIASVAPGDPARTEFDWVGAREFGGLRNPLGPRGLPLFKPPWGRITAIDLRRGEILWQAPVGDGPRRLVESLTGRDPGPLGSASGLVHVLATASLVMATKGVGASADDPGGLWAFDKKEGRLIAFVPLAGDPGGSPITYLHHDRQHVAIAVSRDDGAQEIVSLALQPTAAAASPASAREPAVAPRPPRGPQSQPTD